MGSNYARMLYKEFEKLSERFDSVEKENTELHREVKRLNSDVSSLRKTCAILQGKNEMLEEENRQLKGQVETLERDNQLLRNDNERMKRTINNDSSNSSQPPSSDSDGKGKPANTYNGRKPTRKSKGGQAGHEGKTLTKREVEKKIESGQFKKRLEIIGEPCMGTYITRYRLDLEINTIATEIRIYPDKDGTYHIPKELCSDVVYGPTVKAMAAQLYCEGVMANDRICTFINSVSGDSLALSGGSIYHFCRDFSNRCIGENEKIKDLILSADVAGTDATVMTTDKKNTYIRNISTEDAVYYYSSDNKKLETLQKMDLLVNFAGIFVHDHETSLYHFGTDNAECNVHLERYLKKNTEETGNRWSHHMSCFLSGMNQARKERKASGRDSFDEGALLIYEARYDAILEEGYEQNKKTKGRLAKKEEKKLLNRLKKYKRNHLLFLHNFKVFYSNNISERDLRKCKNREKMAGGFRKPEGREMFCRILSFTETVKRRKQNLFSSIVSLFEGKPVIQR